MIDNMLDKTTDWLLNKKPEIEWNDKLNDNSNIIELHDNNIHVVKTEQLRNYLIYIQDNQLVEDIHLYYMFLDSIPEQSNYEIRLSPFDLMEFKNKLMAVVTIPHKETNNILTLINVAYGSWDCKFESGCQIQLSDEQYEMFIRLESHKPYILK